MRWATRRGRKSQITGAGEEGSSASVLRVVCEWVTNFSMVSCEGE